MHWNNHQSTEPCHLLLKKQLSPQNDQHGIVGKLSLQTDQIAFTTISNISTKSYWYTVYPYHPTPVTLYIQVL